MSPKEYRKELLEGVKISKHVVIHLKAKSQF